MRAAFVVLPLSEPNAHRTEVLWRAARSGRGGCVDVLAWVSDTSPWDDDYGGSCPRPRQRVLSVSSANPSNGEQVCEWVAYQDYTRPVLEASLWFPAPTTTNVVQFGSRALRHDFATQNGRENIDGWIELAPGVAGR